MKCGCYDIKNTKGLSLIEIIVSIAILALIMVTVTFLLVTTIVSNRASQEKYDTSLMVQRIIEEERTTENIQSYEKNSGLYNIKVDFSELKLDDLMNRDDGYIHTEDWVDNLEQGRLYWIHIDVYKNDTKINEFVSIKEVVNNAIEEPIHKQ